MAVEQYGMPALIAASAPPNLNGEGRSRTDGVAEMVARYLGTEVMRAVADPNLTEVYANPDGVLRVDRRGTGREATAVRLSPERIEAFLNAVATGSGATLGPDHPRLAAELPRALFRGARLQGFVPPVVASPCFVIRMPASVVYPLEQYVADGVMTADEAAYLVRAVIDRVAVLLAGGTGSGKTMLLNALVDVIRRHCATDRLVVLEDTVELQCTALDVLQLRSGPGVSLRDLGRDTLRSAPDRIIVGEVRGAEALDMLKAWETGHPGGLGTVHADTAVGALERLDDLAQEANVPPQRRRIATAVGMVAVLRRTSTGRRLVELARVTGIAPDGQFLLHDLTAHHPTTLHAADGS